MYVPAAGSPPPPMSPFGSMAREVRMRSVFGVYTGAFLVAGMMCAVAALGVLAIQRRGPRPVAVVA